MLSKIKQDAESAMKKALEHTVKEFSTIHTGKAAPAMVENIQVEAYGSMMRLKDTASVSTPDARTIVITPFDKSIIKDIEKAILGANVGLTPANMGSFVRCSVPELSGERRAELVKVANRKSCKTHHTTLVCCHIKLTVTTAVKEDDLNEIP